MESVDGVCDTASTNHVLVVGVDMAMVTVLSTAAAVDVTDVDSPILLRTMLESVITDVMVRVVLSDNVVVVLIVPDVMAASCIKNKTN